MLKGLNLPVLGSRQVAVTVAQEVQARLIEEHQEQLENPVDIVFRMRRI